MPVHRRMSALRPAPSADNVGCPREILVMTSWRLPIHALVAGMLLGVGLAPRADEICTDRTDFEKSGWQLKPVQRAMDDYLRDHGIRVNWLHEPRPPNAVGRDYYEWLWIDEFGAGMKAELVRRFCGGATDAGPERQQ
jgi:hypothetical protein